jgi:hypothetical protein
MSRPRYTSSFSQQKRFFFVEIFLVVMIFFNRNDREEFTHKIVELCIVI